MVFSGEVGNLRLRSQICMTGVWSSSLAIHNWVAYSGCQETTLHLIRLVESETWIIGSFFLKSQTTHLLKKVLARMYGTCLIHATHLTSSNGCILAPEVYKSAQLVDIPDNIELGFATTTGQEVRLKRLKSTERQQVKGACL